MKKKLKLATLIKRTLIIVLALSVISVVLVYMFNKYAPTVNAATNKYKDEFWNSETLEGFTPASDYIEKTGKWDYTNKEQYVAPNKVNGKTANDFSNDVAELEEVIQSARYQEELTMIFAKYITPKMSVLGDKYTELNDFKKKYNDTLPAWENYYAETLLGYGGLATDYPNQPVLKVPSNNNGTLEFWFNTYLSTFKLIEKDATGNTVQVWESNPEKLDEAANPSVQTAQKSVFNLYYAALNGETGYYSAYEYAVKDKNSYGDELVPNFSVNIDSENNTVTVWYKLTKRDIDYTYFPKYISKESMDSYLARNAELSANSEKDEKGNPTIVNIMEDNRVRFDFFQYYKLVPADDQNNKLGYDYYEFYTSLPQMSRQVRNFLLKHLYEGCGYTESDLASDNNEFGEDSNVVKAEYSLAIEYQLTSDGLDVTIPGNSIKENEKYPVTYIELLPYFTATINKDEQGNEISGYTVVPDGSGAILEHNNGKMGYKKYQKRVYTTDLSSTSYINQGDFEDLMFPMYAVVNTGNNSGILAYATNGGAQLQLTADVSGRQDSYNMNYFTIFYREQKQVVLGSGAYKTYLTKWTNDRVKDDIAISFDLLSQDELSYSKVAKKYRTILQEIYKIESNDTTTTPVLNMDVLGSYTYRENFLGVPYTAKDTLTTIDQLNEIIKTFSDLSIQNMNVYYDGWRSTGLSNTSFKKVKVSNLIGSKAKFEALLKESTTGATLYPYVSFAEYEDYQESFGKTHYTTHAVDGDIVFRQPYDLNSNVYDKTKSKIYALSPRYYISFGNTLAEQYKKATKDYNAIAINQLGSSLSGDYRKGIETFKVDAVDNQKVVLQNFIDNGIDTLALYTPYDYAFQYVNVVKEIPYQATQYEILDYSVPFYQLVINGLFDYSSESVNEEIGKGITEHVMRMIETGSNISFTFSGDSSEKLIQTNYNNYYYTLYTDWVDDVKAIYDELNNLGIYGYELDTHECLGNNVFKVTYKLNADEIIIYLNYSRNAYQAPNGLVVEAKSYAVAK